MTEQTLGLAPVGDERLTGQAMRDLYSAIRNEYSTISNAIDAD